MAVTSPVMTAEGEHQIDVNSGAKSGSSMLFMDIEPGTKTKHLLALPLSPSLER
jgi:hypothetical protein